MRLRLRVGGVLALLTLVGPRGVTAQVGAVVEAEAGVGLSGAEVTWVGPDGVTRARLVTDGAGSFRVPDAWGPGDVIVRALGHRDASFTVDAARALGWRLPVELDPLQLDALVVTAAGREQSRSEVAVPIVRLGAQEFETSGAASVGALLDGLPGLQSSPGVPVGSTIQIRGIGESRVLVLIDGQPSSGALVEDRDLTRLSLSSAERVEVVKGPLSSLYGSDALGGVINVITRAPEEGFTAGGRLLSGDGGRLQGSASVMGGGRVRSRVTASLRQEDRVPGLDDGSDTFARVWDVTSSTRASLGERVEVRADASFVRERQKWPVGGGFNGFNDNHGLTAWTEATIASGPGAWVVRAFGQGYEHEYRASRGDVPIAGTGDGSQIERLWKATVGYGAGIGRHHFDVGVEAATRSIESPDKILEDRAADDQLDVFAQDAIRLGRSTWTVGARGTHNDRWGSTLSPTIGVVVVPTDRLSARLSVGRGFRAPSFKELAWDFANVGAGYTVRGFADLQPEQSWSVSVGTDIVLTSGFVLTVDGFRNDVSNLIETAFVGFLPSGLQEYSPRNVAEARTQGVEVGGQLVRGGWQVSADYALLDAKSLDGDVPLDRRSRHSGRLRVEREVPVLAGAASSLTVQWLGDAPLVGTEIDGTSTRIGTQEALVSVDAHLALSLRAGVRLVAGVTNLFDTRPDGWQAVIERRMRIGLEATDLF